MPEPFQQMCSIRKCFTRNSHPYISHFLSMCFFLIQLISVSSSLQSQSFGKVIATLIPLRIWPCLQTQLSPPLTDFGLAFASLQTPPGIVSQLTQFHSPPPTLPPASRPLLLLLLFSLLTKHSSCIDPYFQGFFSQCHDSRSVGKTPISPKFVNLISFSSTFLDSLYLRKPFVISLVLWYDSSVESPSFSLPKCQSLM